MDDYIAQIQQSKSKKKARNKNPLPDFACVFGWCKGSPKPAPKSRAGTAAEGTKPNSTNPAAIKCDLEMEQVLDAAHDVDVGDTYFEEKNYRAALFRYQDAAKQKPDDAAIEVRLGRAYEKLDQPEQAAIQYTAAAKLAGPDRWTHEARASLARLQRTP